LATAADVSQRDPAKTVELANKAIELRPDDANHWNLLNVAQYRAGNWQAAVEALEKADAMIEGGDRPHRMFLAMAHWQLGNQDKARQRYAQGAAWIAAHAQNDEEQQRFRAEAEQLMGITEDARQELAEQYGARPADNQTPAPSERPHDTKPETDNPTGLLSVAPRGAAPNTV
jgi:tetratricopeptide (TPR) repeat protein